MPETALIEGEILLASAEDRTVRGMLMPYGETSRKSNVGPISFARGTLKIPRDPSVVGANLQHNHYDPVGRATLLEDTDAGLVATFAIADTEEGDQLLADIKEGKLSRLSAEVKNIVRNGTKAIAGVLTGAAFVTTGAFESAALFALGDVTEEEEAPEAPAPLEPVDGVIAITATSIPDAVTVTAEGADTIFTPEPTNPESENLMAAAAVPNTLAPASAAVAPTSIRDVATALAKFSSHGDRSGIDAIAEADRPTGETGMFALNDIKVTTAGSVGVNIVQPQWLGELWRGREYVRRITPLITNAPLTSFKVTGFRWLVEPAMAAWAGDKANVPTNTPTTEPYTLAALRYAGGHDIAREYYDFDVPEFWEAYFRAMSTSYAKLTDDAALAALVAGATPVTAGAVPAGTNSGLVSIVDGSLAVLDTGVPTFAVVAKDVYRSIALTKDIDKLAFLNTSLGLEEGTIESFKVIAHPNMAAGKTLVGVGGAASFYELPGAAPIRTEALDQVRGGIDEALFGYAVTGINRPAGLALVTPAV
jgi:hypothetical protein